MRCITADAGTEGAEGGGKTRKASESIGKLKRSENLKSAEVFLGRAVVEKNSLREKAYYHLLPFSGQKRSSLW